LRIAECGLGIGDCGLGIAFWVVTVGGGYVVICDVRRRHRVALLCVGNVEDVWSSIAVVL